MHGQWTELLREGSRIFHLAISERVRRQCKVAPRRGPLAQHNLLLALGAGEARLSQENLDVFLFLFLSRPPTSTEVANEDYTLECDTIGEYSRKMISPHPR